MESTNRQEAERILREQKRPASEQAQRRQQVAPGLKQADGFGTPGEGGPDEYYAPGDSGEERPTREAADEISDPHGAGGPDEGLTGFGPGGASDADNRDSIENIERRDNA
jgi:hypothetical protein